MAIRITEHYSYGPTNCKTYDVSFFNESIFTTVTHEPTRVDEWIFDVKPPTAPGLLVGLDVEWRPSFSPVRNPVATLQLCVGGSCLIYQICHSRYIPQSLARFLSDYRNTFVGKGVKSDLDKLQEDYQIGGGASYLDLGELAARAYGDNEWKRLGLKTLANQVLGRGFEKPEAVTMSRWDNVSLTAAQVQYACIDAFLSFEIARNLGA